MAQGGITVGVVAARVGVTVRTLHHWDRIGLASPSGSSPAGYRLYEMADVDRLRRVATYRAAGLSLEEIGERQCGRTSLCKHPTMMQT
ncbi:MULTISPECIES: MerR family transcriptional regulator [unclassified Luteococcus]|uniref:MerR family transcriptional regulator n=1 Tax=unclassified Luteococcus TaxID=2639923 RepID=UPI00313D6476